MVMERTIEVVLSIALCVTVSVIVLIGCAGMITAFVESHSNTDHCETCQCDE
jgi:hypothetical protein